MNDVEMERDKLIGEIAKLKERLAENRKQSLTLEIERIQIRYSLEIHEKELKNMENILKMRKR